MSRPLIALAMMPWLVLLAACQSRAPMPTVDHVELTRFMGPWYVIGVIPTLLERGAFNPVEHYALREDGSIDTTFTFRKDSFEGKVKTMTPRGFVLDAKTNARWGMRFIWPIKADYRIVYLDETYSQTVVGREKRDYVWIMARTPQIPDADYERLLDVVRTNGYEVAKVVKVPQRWPEATSRPGITP